MGRNRTGIITTNEVTRIELSYLLNAGYIQKNKHISGVLEWNNGNTINIETLYSNDEAYIRLDYINTNRKTGKKTTHDYKINLTTVPSNLKNGNLIYFVCPETQNKCRILYKCYGSEIWKSREAYQKRIYYETQQVSKRDYYHTRYFAIEKELQKLYSKQKKSHYRGKETRLQQRINYLQIQLLRFDNLRMIETEKILKKLEYS